MKKNCGVKVSRSQAIKNRAAGMKGKRLSRRLPRTGCVMVGDDEPQDPESLDRPAPRVPELTKPCEFGRAGVCCWATTDEESFFCSWQFVRNNPGGATLQEVADALGISRQRAKQIEDQAVKNMKEVASQNPTLTEDL